MRKLGIITLTLALATILGGCSLRGNSANNSQPTTPAAKKQLINALAIKDRPFIALFPHSTGKLITLYFDKPGKPDSITIDIEYLAGNALKGGRTSINTSASMPYTQAFLLGSCSAGGKCSFDTDITSGDIKTKLEMGNEINVLKSNYAFVAPTGETSTSDGKMFFTPSAKLKTSLILGETHGYIGQFDKEVSVEPVALTSSSDKPVVGQLRIVGQNISTLVYFDGTSYQSIPATKTSDGLTANINLKPWNKTVSIIRDDLKGAKEDVTLNLVGPFIAY